MCSHVHIYLSPVAEPSMTAAWGGVDTNDIIWGGTCTYDTNLFGARVAICVAIVGSTWTTVCNFASLAFVADLFVDPCFWS